MLLALLFRSFWWSKNVIANPNTANWTEKKTKSLFSITQSRGNKSGTGARNCCHCRTNTVCMTNAVGHAGLKASISLNEWITCQSMMGDYKHMYFILFEVYILLKIQVMTAFDRFVFLCRHLLLTMPIHFLKMLVTLKLLLVTILAGRVSLVKKQQQNNNNKQQSERL